MQTTIAAIKAHPVYQQIMKDSFGGVMYNVANHGTYDLTEIKPLWESLTNNERSAADGIIKGAMSFVTSKDGRS